MSKSTARLDVRLRQSSKQVIEEAAALSGQALSDYVVSTLISHSTEVLEKHRQILLSNRDRDRFLELLAAEDEPTPDLKKAVKKFNRNSHTGR